MIRICIRATTLLAAALLLSSPASAQVVQSVQFGVGGFFPRGFDSRDADDVLVRNLVGQAMPGDPSLSDALFFEVKDFRSAKVFGEWNVALGRHIELGAGVGVYGRSVPTFYLDLEDDNGFDINQTLRLRVIPVTGVIRFLPFGTPSDVQPYVGVGISALNFRYSEIGTFVNPNTLDIFDERYVKRGTAMGGLLIGGLRIPINGDIYALTLEGRYQYGVADINDEDTTFVADKIDLGGGHFNVGFLVRF
jgi:hypothetical protein